MQQIISVIVNSYNQEKLIRRTLDSILKQECEIPFEIIIGDDASTDDTRNICEQYSLRYPSIIRLMPKEPNKGVLQNYFDCVRMANGEFMMDCAGDDEWMPGRMQLAYDTLKQHPNVGMALSSFIPRREYDQKILHKSRTIWKEGEYSGEELTYGFACAKGWSPGTFLILRLPLLKKAMMRWPKFFTGREFLMEDMQQYTTMGMLGGMYYIAQPTFYYSINSENASLGTDERRRLTFETNALKLLVELAKELPLDRQRILPAMQHRMFTILMHCFRLHDKEARQTTLDLAKEKGIVLTDKAAMIKVVTSNSLFWNIMLGTRKLFVLFKKIF